MKNCDLCRLADGDIKTRKYFENHVCIIVDCSTCGPNHPMIVLKRHTMKPTQSELESMEQITRMLFPKMKWRDNPAQRKNLEHWHRHIIDRSGRR